MSLLPEHTIWRAGNVLRRVVGLSAQPKRCCRKERNLGPVTVMPGDGTLSFRRCMVCQCRHFEAVAEPHKFGLRSV